MSGGPHTDLPAGASGGDNPNPGMPSSGAPGPTLGSARSDTPAAGFDRNAEATPMARAAAPQPSPVFYRSEQDRARSVYRRANPWHRRLGRGVVLLCFVAVGGAVLYFGARELQDYLNRDRLPSAGVEIPEFRSTQFLITSSAPAPAIEGSLTLDVDTRAFYFQGGAGGPQAGIEVMSSDGTQVFVRSGSGAWRSADGTDSVVDDIRGVIPYLVRVDSPDDLLGNRMRNGYVTLIDETAEGVGETALTRYEMTFNTTAFASDNPLLWAAFAQEVIPGVDESRDLPVTMWLDADDVVVRLRDAATNWAWERVSYGTDSFDPTDSFGTP